MPLTNGSRWSKTGCGNKKVIPPCDKTERKTVNRVIICGAFNRERYRELINPSVVVMGAATPIMLYRVWAAHSRRLREYRQNVIVQVK